MLIARGARRVWPWMMFIKMSSAASFQSSALMILSPSTTLCSIQGPVSACLKYGDARMRCREESRSRIS